MFVVMVENYYELQENFSSLITIGRELFWNIPEEWLRKRKHACQPVTGPFLLRESIAARHRAFL
jgi:hypothetical protein